jgi:hypothetical protein
MNKTASGEDLTTLGGRERGKKEHLDCRKKLICKESTTSKIWHYLMPIIHQEAKAKAEAGVSVAVDEDVLQLIENREPLNKNIPMKKTVEEMIGDRDPTVGGGRGDRGSIIQGEIQEEENLDLEEELAQQEIEKRMNRNQGLQKLQ